MDLKAYAAASGKEYVSLHDKVKAWRVYSPVMHVHKAPAEFRHLTAIHGAPSWLWGALVEKMTSEAWTVAWAPRARVGGTSIRADRGELKRGSPRARGRH